MKKFQTPAARRRQVALAREAVAQASSPEAQALAQASLDGLAAYLLREGQGRFLIGG